MVSARALIKLCQSTDPDTQRYALQTLELLSIESSDMICAQVGIFVLSANCIGVDFQVSIFFFFFFY